MTQRKYVLIAALFAGAASCVTLGLASSQASAATQLNVYTAVEPEELVKFAKAFEAKHPDIKIKWVRDSTGIMTAKLLAEGKNTKADIIWTSARMIASAETSILLVDHTKFGKLTSVGIRDTELAKLVVTDRPPGSEIESALQRHGLKLRIAD